ncbi:hypothetical protein H4582DRAFT_906241 [Lactarius indigo]|nr:hypothetical protein H4582DRAFT_906241 [Lactarius indigo]
MRLPIGSPGHRLVNPPPPPATLVRPSNQDQRPRSSSRGRVNAHKLLDGPDDFSSTRGREPRSPFNLDKIISIGRGGAGNIRSPSRDVDPARPIRKVDYSRPWDCPRRSIALGRKGWCWKHGPPRLPVPGYLSVYASRSRGVNYLATRQQNEWPSLPRRIHTPESRFQGGTVPEEGPVRVSTIQGHLGFMPTKSEW